MSEMDRSEFVQSASVLGMGLTLLLHQRMPDMGKEELAEWLRAHIGDGDSVKIYALLAFATGRVSRSAFEVALDDRELLGDVASLVGTEDLGTVVHIAHIGFAMDPELKSGAELLAGESYDKHARETK